MKQVNVIRHLAFEDLGCFADVLAQQGFAVNYYEAGVDDLAALQADSDDWLIILGGPISANDVDDFPFLKTEIALLRERIRLDKPTLGICLGAQLMARATGQAVYPGKAKEIGWMPVVLTDAGNASPLAALESCNNVVLHWHGETFDLPDEAVLLASTDIAVNQAFRIGDNIYGLQFHLEATPQGMERWFIGHIGEIEQTEGVSVKQLRADTARYAKQTEAAGRLFLQALLAQTVI